MVVHGSSGLAAPTPHRGVDRHTLALWLFDDPPYANAILTDAGPYQVDLRLETGCKRPLPATMRDGTRGLVLGRFGRALHLPIGEDAGVTWPTNPRVYNGVPPHV